MSSSKIHFCYIIISTEFKEKHTLEQDELFCCVIISFPSGSCGIESACSVGDPGSVPALGRSPGEGNGNPLQYSCLENSTDREAW